MRKQQPDQQSESENEIAEHGILHDAVLRPKPIGKAISAATAEYKLGVQASQRNATHNNVTAHLDPWVRRMAACGITHMDQITSKAILQDLIWLRETPSVRTGKLRSDLTIRSSAVAIKGFLSWAYDQGHVSKRLLDDYIIPKGRKASVYNPNSENLTALFSLIDDFWNPELRPEIAAWPESILEFYKTRLIAFLLLQMTTALRIGETCHVELHDWDQVRGIITARVTKTGDPRDVPVDSVVAQALGEWVAKRPKPCRSNYLFTTEMGDKMRPATMTQTLRRYLIWGRERGIEIPRITLHSLRHYALSGVAAVSLSQAQELAGHADPKTTKLYVQTSTQQVRDAVSQANLLGGVIVNKRAAKRKGGKPRGKRAFLKN